MVRFERRLAWSLPSLVLAALALAVLQAARPVTAAESYDGCAGFIDSLPATISAQGVWCLRHDLGTALASGSAIEVATNNVTIDCNGFKLGGLAAGDQSQARGINASYRQNLTVRNCSIRGFAYGVRLLGGAGHLVEDNRLDNNLAVGIQLYAVETSVVRGNRVADTGGAPGGGVRIGIRVNASEGAMYEVAGNAVDGVFGTAGQANTVYGIHLYGGTGARVDGNRVSGLLTEPDGAARGISVQGPAFVTGNQAATGVPVASSRGIDCPGGDASLRGNMTFGFDDPYVNCIDHGGNAFLQ